MRHVKHGTVLVALLLASSCTTAKLEELRQVSPEGTAFQKALAREYLAFSESEARQYDWVDSYHFADKGLRAAYGQEVAPENPADWNVEEALRPEFAEARERLIAAFTPQNLEAKAETAARAQYFYDCWLEQQEEAWQTEDINACKEGLESALADLAGEPEESAIPLMRSTAYMVFFDHNQATLTSEGLEVLHRVVEDLAKFPEAEVLLHGHADTSGEEDYNMGLSERRAAAVRGVLTEGGVAESRIAYYAFGETDLRIPTADGIREPGNRRVEIFLE